LKLKSSGGFQPPPGGEQIHKLLVQNELLNGLRVANIRAMLQERPMSGPFSIKLSILVPVVLCAILPLFAQVAPPQGFPPQGGTPQGGAADGGDQQDGPASAAAGVARISLLNGDVSVRRGDSGDYVAAVQNAPVMVQDSIQTGSGARAEVQFDIANMVRLAQTTEVHFTDLQNGRFQMQLGRGTITYRLLRDTNAQVEIDTPSISIRPTQQGVYRITVTDDGQTYVTPRNGQVEVFTPKGSQAVQTGQTLMARGPSSDPEYQMVGALNRDEWDNWSDTRDQVFQQAWANTQRYVPQGVYGTEELAGQGQWVNTPEYGGYAWAPNVGPDWSPYSNGNWVWADYYGWTWVSYDPWGWAPYHYGRWFNRPGLGWAWWPGLYGGHYYFRPGLVGFFGFGAGFGGVGFGSIGWVPLAPFEFYHPWYGRGGFNNLAFVHNTNVANTYRNAGVRNGVVGVNAQQFGRGAIGYSHVSGANLRSVSMMHGPLPVKPNSQSMRFTNRSTSTVAHTNFSQTRFASHTQAPAVQRSSYGTSPGSSFSRYGGTTGSGAGSSPISGARQFGSTAGTRTIPQSSGSEPARSGGANWSRFGSSGASGPARSSYGGGSYSTAPSYNGGRSQLQVSPPLVRQRGTSSAPSSGGYSAPRYSGPSYSPPRYSAPAQQSTPHYSAPAQHSAPSSGGGGRPSGGGGGGGGGGHRR
jgi:hypothetical protein